MSRRADRIFVWGLKGSAALAALIVVLVVGFLAAESAPALVDIGITRFFSDPSWHPTEDSWGLAPMLWGSLAATFGAVLVAMPLAVLSAVFCRYYAPPAVAGVFRRMIELLAGIPSVVFGFWGLVVLVPLIAKVAPPGPSLLAAMLVLAIMILPTVALVAESSLSQVPTSLLNGGYALGLSRTAVVWKVAVPHARAGILTGLMLGAARAIGETMAVLMVCGGVVNTPDSLFAPIRTLTAGIAMEMAYAMDGHRSALFVSGLVLVLAVIGLVMVAHRLESRMAHV